MRTSVSGEASEEKGIQPVKRSAEKKSKPTILVVSHSSTGGLAEYIFYQAEALASLGAEITMMVGTDFLGGRRIPFARIIYWTGLELRPTVPLVRKLLMFWSTLIDKGKLAWQIWKLRPDLVLLDCYVEYLSPFWVWPHWALAKLFKICYAANLHDPVRSYVIGPMWWHKLSIKMAYLPLKFVLVHEQPPVPSPIPNGVRSVKVPHGLYDMSGTVPDPLMVRSDWGVRNGQKVFLAFGFVRDGKNLDLAVRALAQIPEAFLVVAGSVPTSKDRQFSFYRELAVECGVADRCRFFEGFVPNQDLAKYFAGADYILLTYAATFHSQSGVLNLAARARKPMLASASPSALLETVRHYDLGIVVEPDSLEAVIAGMKDLLSAHPQPRWSDYEVAASWSVNAREVLMAAGLEVKLAEGHAPD